MKYLTRNVFASIVILTALAAIAIAAGVAGSSASGHGTLFVENDSNGNSTRRQFSFSAHEQADGTVIGNAVLVNPAFTAGDSTQKYMLQIDISCMNIIGNVAFFGGTTRRTNDESIVDAVYFSVEDNGNPGRGVDRISSVFFYDDDPTTMGDPALCEGNQIGDFPMEEIEAGNINVRP